MSPVGNAKIERANQLYEPGDIVELYEMDLSKVSGETYRFTPCVTGDVLAQSPVSFGGELYMPQPVIVNGFEWVTGQQFPRPRMRVSNVAGTLGSALRAYDDMVGVIVVKIATYARHLDDGDDPDSEARFPDEVYKIKRKVKSNMMEVEFEIGSAVDQQGRLLPGRTIQRSCGLRYRRANSDASETLPTSQRFDYSGYNVCPYAGDAMFDEFENVVTDPARDKCGKRFSSCRARFPSPEFLPAWFFPGVGRIR